MSVVQHSVPNFCFPVSLFRFPVSLFPGNKETGKQRFWFCKGNRETGKQLSVQIGKQGKLFPCFPLVVFSYKYPKNGSRSSFLGKFVVILINISEKSRIFENKIKLILEKIQSLIADIVWTDSNYCKINDKWLLTLDFDRIYLLNVQIIKKVWKNNSDLRKKFWRETRETGKLFPWETGKQGNSTSEN